MDEATKEWLENQKKICLCTGVKKATFIKLLKEGVTSIEELVRRSGACRGGCQGKRCYEEIVKIYDEYMQK